MPNTYLLVHRPEQDATGYRMPDRIDGETTVLDVITFRLADPADEHEVTVALTLSRAAWEAQGSPEELLLALSAPIREEPADA